jgi:hypothetical protein
MISFKEYLVERRKNPELNQKLDPYDQISALFDRVGATTLSKQRDYFFSFTDVAKLGVNPRSEYDTPMGIYFYLASSIVKAIKRKNFKRFIPFGAERKYIQVAKVKSGANVIYLDEVDESTIEKYAQKIFDLMNGRSHFDTVEQFKKSSHRDAKEDTAAGRLWWMLWFASRDIAIDRQAAPDNGKSVYSRSAAAWNGIMRKLGIDGVVDPGLMLIHENEPTQAVFFSTKALEHVETILNTKPGTKDSVTDQTDD